MQKRLLSKSYILLSRNITLGMGEKKVLAIIFVFAAMLLIPNTSFAIHNSEELTWQLVMISSYPACSNYHYQMTVRYDDITKNYLDLYQLENTNYKPECMTELKYQTEYQIPDDLDLLIVVYDRNKGRADLHSNYIGGFYNHFGGEWTHNHTIVFCDCSNFQYSDPNWILTHELSHFVLYYLGFDSKIVEDHVHQQDALYDFCVEEEYNEVKCSPVKTRLDTDYHEWTVMAPYAPAIGKKVFPTDIEENIGIPEYKMSIQKQITNWWIDGLIQDEDYAKSLEILGKNEIEYRNSPDFVSKESKNVIFTDPPKFMKDELLSESNNIKEWVQEREATILGMVQLAQKIEDTQSDDEETKELPQWFKTRAIWWINDKISEQEFLNGMYYIFNN